MVESLKIEVALEGQEDVKRDLYDIGVAGREAFLGMAASAARFSLALGTIAAGLATIGTKKLLGFANAAEETEKALTQLQKVSGASFENLSALSQVFARGGTSVNKFASAMSNLAEKMAAAGQKALTRNANKDTVEWANNLDSVRNQFDLLAQGFKQTFNPLTTLNIKVEALFESLAKGRNLADIFKNLGSDLERAELGKAIGLTPEQIATLSQGSAKIKEMADEVRQLGLVLDDLDQADLTELRQSQTELGALWDSLKDKLGALAAPAFTSFFQGFTDQIKALIPAFTQLADRFGQFDFSRLGAGLADIVLALAKVATGWAAILTGQVSFGDVLAGLLEQAKQTLIPVAQAIGFAIGKEIINGLFSGLGNPGIILKNWFISIVKALPGAGGSSGGGSEGFASGGLLGGIGTGTSDSNLAWVSRGEYITPARAVAQPGVLMFLEALRRSGGNLAHVLDGMGRFALGGMVPRAMPAFASGGLAGGMSNVTIQFPGLPAIGGLRASSDVVEQLHKAAALAQVRSGGRKPSRYA